MLFSLLFNPHVASSISRSPRWAPRGRRILKKRNSRRLCRDSRNGWGATIVDAMDTMKIMGLEVRMGSRPAARYDRLHEAHCLCVPQADFTDALNFTAHIDFSRSHTSDSVSLFETNIRYLGGMLSAYELGGKTDETLVKQAVALGDKLAFAWVGDNACES